MKDISDVLATYGFFCLTAFPGITVGTVLRESRIPTGPEYVIVWLAITGGMLFGTVIGSVIKRIWPTTN